MPLTGRKARFLLNVDRDSKSPQPPSFQPQDRWVKIALYAGLLLVVGWLYFSSASETTPANGDRGGNPTASADQSSEKIPNNSTPWQKQEGPASQDRENNSL